MRVIAYTHLDNVYTDVKHSDVDVQFNIEVSGAKGENPDKFTVTSYTSFSSCYGTAIKIASYYDVNKQYPGSHFLKLTSVIVTVPGTLYTALNCKGMGRNYPVSVSAITCYINGQDIFSYYKKAVGSTSVVDYSFSDSTMKYDGVSFSRTGSAPCTTSLTTSETILLVVGVVIVFVIVVVILVKTCNNTKTLPKKCDSLLDTRKANESTQ